MTPEINFQAEPRPAGYLESSWSQPQLIIANNEVVALASRSYVVSVAFITDQPQLQEYNVSDNHLILPRPLWDTTYTFTLHCGLQDLESLNCGRFEVKAMLQGKDQIVHS